MNDLEVKEAIDKGLVLVCQGAYRKTFFEPLKVNGEGFIEAKPTVNSRCLENGMFALFGANGWACRTATHKETKWFNELKKRSKFLKVTTPNN